MNYTVMAYTRRENRELESAMHLAAVLENGSLPKRNLTKALCAAPRKSCGSHGCSA